MIKRRNLVLIVFMHFDADVLQRQMVCKERFVIVRLLWGAGNNRDYCGINIRAHRPKM